MFTKISVLDARKETEHAKCAIKKGFCESSHIFLRVQVLTDIALRTISKNSRNIYSNHSINLLNIISAVFGKFILLNDQSHDS